MTSFKERLDSHQLAGLFTWALITAVTVYAIAASPDFFTKGIWPAISLSIAYLLALLVTTVHRFNGGSRSVALTGLWLQLGFAFALGFLYPLSFLPIYTIIWLSIAPHYYSMSRCWFFLIAISLAWFLLQHFGWESSGALITTLLYSTFHLFAMFSARATLIAEEASARSQALNRELLATQHLLSEASRQSERTRIARDLHDVVGHHLTALTINLQLAERQSSGEAKENIERCHSISKLLLSDVRSAVSALREQAPVDFLSSLRLIAENVPGLQIELDVAEDLALDDVEIAESLLRCVQEALTNTLRHTKATTSVLRMQRVEDSLHLSYTDNGAAQTMPAPGNGLTGMRERVERLNGELKVDIIRGALSLDISIPAPA